MVIPLSKRPWIIVAAITLHLVWASTLMFSDAPLNITGIASIVNLGVTTAHGAALLYFTVALLALLGLIAPPPAGFFFLLPQQFILIGSAVGAIACMWNGTFADGVTRPYSFLIADQSPVVIMAVFHTMAVWSNFLIHLGGRTDGA